MIKVESDFLRTIVYTGLVLVDHENKANQQFSIFHIIPHGKDDVLTMSTEERSAINAEIINTMRMQFDQMIRNLEYVIKNQKRPEYLIEINEGMDGYESTCFAEW